MEQGMVSSYKRSLDMKLGTLTREVEWISPKGITVNFTFERLVSFVRKNIAAQKIRIKVSQDASIKINSRLNGHIKNREAGHDPRTGSHFKGEVLKSLFCNIKENLGWLGLEAPGSGINLLVGAIHNLPSNTMNQSFKVKDEKMVESNFEFDMKKDEEFQIEKILSYYSEPTPIDWDLYTNKAGSKLEQIAGIGFSVLKEEQEKFLDEFWAASDIKITGDEEVQQGIRFNLFHLLQSTGRDGITNIAAKGLTGEGYEGHYFWDSEIYIHPFFTFTKPSIAKNMLEYRYQTLDAARDRAHEMAGKGALYPWRTINGEECSAYYPAGTAQFHINGDIIYALKMYMEVNEDWDFLIEKGAEMVFETARFWLSLGGYVNGQFCINEVTGPDEYTALVNNNLYTNIMAQEHLWYAFNIAQEIKKEDSLGFDKILNKLDLEKSEIDSWRDAADKMLIPFDNERRLYPQDDCFFQKEVWDFDNTPKEKYPLLLHYHPLVIYRYQVLKQPDVIMALFLHSHRFSLEEKRRNFAYYEPITTGDSSLAHCVHNIIACEIGEMDKAYDYFLKTLRMDLDDIHGNVKDGVHTAAMGGSWLSVVYGFSGMRIKGSELEFSPRLPKEWKSIEFKIKFKGRIIECKFLSEKSIYSLLVGEPLRLKHFDNDVFLKTGEKKVL
jgi:alpha,alpha-trehalose phosphorylase